MKFTFVLLLLCARHAFMKNVERMSENRVNLDRLIDQLSRVRGFKSCNLYVESKLKSNRVVDMLQLQLTKRFPIVSVGKKSSQLWKFKRTDFSQMIKWKKREQKGLHCSASGNSILIAIVGWTGNKPKFMVNVREVFQTMALRSSVPKLLVISLTNKERDYKKVFNYFTSVKIIDVDILEISVSNRRLRAGRKVRGFLNSDSGNFTVHKCNPFKNSFKRQSLKGNVGWFEPKVENCYGTQLKLHPNSKGRLESHIIWGGRNVTWQFFGPDSAAAIHFMNSMNVTFVKARSVAEFDILLDMRNSTWDSLNDTFLKSFEFERYEFYTPVIHDSQLSFNIDYLIFYFAAVLVTLLLLQMCCIFGHFDRRTWSSYEIVKMLFGFPNPRYPKLVVESALFCLFSLGGICIANFVSEALTDTLVPVEEERLFNTFDDLRDSNVTLCLQFKPTTEHKQLGITHENAIVKSGVSFQVEKTSIPRYLELMGEIVNCKNMSVSCYANREFSMYSPKIMIDGKLRARRSHLTECWVLWSYPMQNFSPYYERMSDLHWRFLECGFTNWKKIVTQYYLHRAEEVLHQSVWRNQQSQEDSGSNNDVTSLLLLYFLFVGSIASIIALIAEKVYFLLIKYTC